MFYNSNIFSIKNADHNLLPNVYICIGIWYVYKTILNTDFTDIFKYLKTPSF